MYLTFSAAHRFQTVRFSLFLRFSDGFSYNVKGRDADELDSMGAGDHPGDHRD